MSRSKSLNGTVEALFRLQISNISDTSALFADHHDFLGDLSLSLLVGPALENVVGFINCLPCETEDHPDLYRNMTFCGGLCLPCSQCTLTEFLTSECKGQSQSVCTPLPTDITTSLELDIRSNPEHLIPVSQVQTEADSRSLNRTFVFTNLAPGESTNVTVEGAGSKIATVTRPLRSVQTISCQAVTEQVSISRPMTVVVFEAFDENNNARVLIPTVVNASLRVEGESEHEGIVSSCSMPQAGPSVCVIEFSVPANWFPSRGVKNLTITYSTDKLSSNSRCSGTPIQLGPQAASPNDENASGILAIVTPIATLYDMDTISVSIMARHNQSIQTFSFELNCGSCNMSLDVENTDVWFLSSTFDDACSKLRVSGFARNRDNGKTAFIQNNGTFQAIDIMSINVTVFSQSEANRVFHFSGKVTVFTQFSKPFSIFDTRFEHQPVHVLASYKEDTVHTNLTEQIHLLRPTAALISINQGLRTVYSFASLKDEPDFFDVNIHTIWPRGEVIRIEKPSGCQIFVQDADNVDLDLNTTCDTFSIQPYDVKLEKASSLDISLQIVDDMETVLGSSALRIQKPARNLYVTAQSNFSHTNSAPIILRSIRKPFVNSVDELQPNFTSAHLDVMATYPNDTQVDVTRISNITSSASDIFTISPNRIVTGVSVGGGMITCGHHGCPNANVSVLGDLPSVPLGTELIVAYDSDIFVIDQEDGRIVINATVTSSRRRSSLIGDMDHAGDAHVILSVLEQVTTIRQQINLLPQQTKFTVENDAFSVKGSSTQLLDAARISTRDSVQGVSFSAQWPRDTCVDTSFPCTATTNVTVNPPRAIRVEIEPAHIDLVVPNTAIDVASLYGRLSNVTVTANVVLNNGVTESIPFPIFQCVGDCHSCIESFNRTLHLNTTSHPGNCSYRLTIDDSHAMLTVRKFSLVDVRITARVSGIDQVSSSENLFISAVGSEDARSWPAVLVSARAVFSDSSIENEVTLESSLLKLSSPEGSNRVNLNDNILVASEPATVNLSVSLADFETELQLHFENETMSDELAITSLEVKGVALDATSSIFELGGVANTSFVLDVSASLGNASLSPSEMRVGGHQMLLFGNSISFTSSDTNALDISDKGIITLKEGRASAVNISARAGNTKPVVILCLPTLFPSVGGGGFGPHDISIREGERIRVPIHFGNISLRAAALELDYPLDNLDFVTVDVGRDVPFAFLQFSSHEKGLVRIFATLPGPISGEDVQVASLVFDIAQQIPEHPLTIRLNGSLVVEEEFTLKKKTVQPLETDLRPLQASRRRRRSSSVSHIGGSSERVQNSLIFQGDGAQDAPLFHGSEVRVRRSGPRGTVSNNLATLGRFDMNSDGIVDILDVVTLLDYYTGRITKQPAEPANPDTNSDGLVTLDDVDYLLNLIAGRLAALKRVAVTPVHAPDSDCMLSFNVTTFVVNKAFSSLLPRFFLDLFNISNDQQFAELFGNVEQGPHFGFVPIPFSGPSFNAAHESSYYLQVSTKQSLSNVGLSALQLGFESTFNFHTIQSSDPTQQIVPSVDKTFVVDNTGISLFFPFGYTPLQVFDSDISTQECLQQRLPRNLTLQRPPPNQDNVVSGYELIVSWEEPSQPPTDTPVTAYFIQYFEILDGSVLEKRVNASKRSVSITKGVLPFRQYDARIQVEFGDRRSVISPNVTERSHQVHK